MRQAARCLIQTRGSSGPWRTVETTTDRTIAEARADTLATETLGFGPAPTATHYPTYSGVRVTQAGKTVYDPRSPRT
jgi:hypothetical protein